MIKTKTLVHTSFSQGSILWKPYPTYLKIHTQRYLEEQFPPKSINLQPQWLFTINQEVKYSLMKIWLTSLAMIEN